MANPSWFKRFLLPGFAFKAVVIGGGYATGRELAEFFVSVGPRGGLLAMLLSTVLFSLICVVTFLFARMHGSTDYRNFFRNLVGPFWVLYEAAYMFSFVLVLAVYGAAAGAIFAAQRFGLVDLIAKGYRILAVLILVTFVLPLLTFGLWRLVKRPPATPAKA